MTNKIALNTVRWAFLLSFFGLSSAAEAQNLPSAPRDFFIGQWERWNNGDTFFPDKILFEADPETTDRLLVTFTLAACIRHRVALRRKREAVQSSGLAVG